jgi:hypothetical protein
VSNAIRFEFLPTRATMSPMQKLSHPFDRRVKLIEWM